MAFAVYIVEFLNSQPTPSQDASSNSTSGEFLASLGIKYLLFFSVGACLFLWWKKISNSRRTTSTLKLPPGPVELPFFGHSLQMGDQVTPRKLARLARKYGDIFLLKMGRRNLVIIHSPEIAKEMLHAQGVQFGSRFSNVVFDIFTGSGQDLAFAEYGEHWRKMRRILTLSFFTNKAVQQWRTVWEAEIDRMVMNLANKREASTTGVKIRNILHLMIFNNIYMMTFGRRFESEDDPLFLELKTLNDERGRLSQSLDYNFGDFNPVFNLLLKGYLKTCWKVKEGRERLFKYFIAERMKVIGGSGAEQAAQKTYGIDRILAAVKAGEIGDQNVLYLLENINGAGVDTILLGLEWTIAELVNNPHVQEKIYAELQRVLGPNGVLTEPDCSKLHYLQAVVKESLRLHSIAPVLVPHMNLKPEKLGGYDIPARSRIMINSWWLSNNPEWWSKPEEFNPERFMEEEAKVEASGNNFKFLPFGSGRRQCPGIVMALPTLRLAIGKLVQRFRLLPPAGMDKLDVSEREGQFLFRLASPPAVVLKPRDTPS